ncbi:MAG: hypothetical protein NVS1B11_30320 [Terriglobales bacterium]
MVLNYLIISRDATGPSAIVCVLTVSIVGLPSKPTTGFPSDPTLCTCCGSISFTVSWGFKVWDTPTETRTIRVTSQLERGAVDVKGEHSTANP